MAKKCKPKPQVKVKAKITSACRLLNCKANSNQTKKQLEVNKIKVLYKGKPKC
jgi:hypothetical protein